MTTIDYDKPVEDLIAALSATGHVTHTSYKKTSVTLHHNGGVNVSHAQILATWKSRPASAHFDVDAQGSVAQYVKVDEYAWAVGSTSGNQSTISIEQTNSTGAPTWDVSETTWKAAARLAAWLFVHVIGAAPSSSNLFPHQHWSATDCPGPYIMKNFPLILAEVQTQYALLKGVLPPVPNPPTSSATKSVAELAKEVLAGQWGNDPQRTQSLRAAGYDPVAVQAQVNADLAKPNPSLLPLQVIAQKVIHGDYGNGQERVNRLRNAGYDPLAVQAEVNKLLK